MSQTSRCKTLNIKLIFLILIFNEFIKYIFLSNDIMPPKKTYKTKAIRTRKPKQTGKGKITDWFKRAGKFIKDKKLNSAGLRGVSTFMPGVLKPISAFAAGVADQLGYGVTLPGAPSQHGGSMMRTLPYRPIYSGTGLSRRVHGSGLLLAGQKANTLRRSRIIKADVLHEQIGSGRIVGNKLY